jgi:hypothetical protein
LFAYSQTLKRSSSSSKEESFVPPIYPKRKNTYDEEWANEVRNKAIATNCTIGSPGRQDSEEQSTPSFEKLETLVDKVKDLYETTEIDNHPEKLKALFACLGQVWAGVCLVNAIIALYAKEKDDFDALSAKIEEKFTELKARDSVIRLRGYIWEIERLLNRPLDQSSSDQLDKNVNCLMQELMVEGSTAALEEICAYLDGGHRMQMERYILYVLHFLFNGMNKNHELLVKKFGQIESDKYIKKQYGRDRQQKVVDNICKILRRFDEEIENNLEKDFDAHYKEQDFDFLTSKYDWLHFHLTSNWQVASGDYSSVYWSSNFAPRKFKRVGENIYILHYIPKDIWIEPTDDDISTARRALREANSDFKPHANRHVLMAKRLNQHNLAWWGSFYGDRNARFKTSSGYTTKCSVVEWMDPFEWRVLICGRK